jgi:hypothetical protein
MDGVIFYLFTQKMGPETQPLQWLPLPLLLKLARTRKATGLEGKEYSIHKEITCWKHQIWSLQRRFV